MQTQNTLFITPPCVELCELKNLFFQLCTITCNLKCKHCYIEQANARNSDDFIELETIKQTLLNLKGKSLNSIYLTGGEPLMHPDFNKILRICLKYANTTVMSNGIMINDKKARFLKKIDDENNYETIYRISLDSTSELENDSLRGRGSFRKALCAILSLIKYEFNPIISVVNYKNRTRQEIFDEFREYFSKKGVELEEINLKIIPYFASEIQSEQIKREDEIDYKNLDCSTSRVISKTGVYSCPVLVGDFRARLGSTLDNSSKMNYLDCEKCTVCVSLKQKAQVNDWM